MVSGKTHVGLNKQENSEYNCPRGCNSVMDYTGRVGQKELHFFRLEVYKRKGISRAKVYKKGRKNCHLSIYKFNRASVSKYLEQSKRKKTHLF